MACLISVLVLRMRPGSHPECALKILIVLGSVFHQTDEAAGGHTLQYFEEPSVRHYHPVRPVRSTLNGPLVLGVTVLYAPTCISAKSRL